MTLKEKVKVENSFKRGWLKVPKGNLAAVKSELMNLFEITSKSGWFAKLDGRTVLKRLEKDAIERIFQKYNITDIWGKD